MSLAPLYTTDFVALRDSDTVSDATAQMLRHRVTDLPVVDGAGKLVGLFKLDRVFASLLPKAALIGYGVPDLNFVGGNIDDLRQHMQSVEHEPVATFVVQPHSVHPDSSPLEVVLLLYRGANSVPVVDEHGRLVGMVSARELLTALHHDA
ncbi:MAG TPA: CBS domain-containing protein [Casimicrobiaceae bacterium]|nr:CBS domain-containing protein [Casimicrobiaceae bacterium]